MSPDSKTNMRRTAFFQILVIVLAFSIVQEAGAIGISTPYLENNILQVPEGGKPVLFTITLQNVEKNDMIARVSYTSTNDVAKIIDYKELYKLPAGSIDNRITFNITIPKTAKVNDVYDLQFSVAPAQPQAGGTIAFTAGVSRNLKVQVTKNPDKFYFANYLAENGLMWLVILSVITAYIAFGIYKRKRKKSKHGKG